MREQDVLAILEALAANDVDACLSGGWGVDALLGTQTRAHSDLDLWLPTESYARSVAALVEIGVDRLLPRGDERPWNFVLHDGAQRKVDLHIYESTPDGSLHFGGIEAGTRFPPEALGGSGWLGGRTVRCEAPEWSVRWRTGYTPRPQDHHDVPRLCERFGLPIPPGFDLP